MLSLFAGIFFPLTFLVFVIFVVAAAIYPTQIRREHMIKTIFNYIVLFITLMMVLGGSIGIFLSLADILVPTTTDNQTFEEYKLYNNVKFVNDSEVKLSDEQLRTMYDESIVLSNQKIVIQAKKNLIRSIGFIIVPLPFFLYFTRLVRNQTTQD